MSDEHAERETPPVNGLPEQPPPAVSARRWALPAGAALLAVVALAALYSTASLDRFGETQAAEADTAAVAILHSTIPPEIGADGFAWQWISYSAGLQLIGEGRVWIGTRAESLRRERVVRLRSKRGRVSVARVGTRPVPVLFGPFDLPRERSLSIETAPGPGVASAEDERRLSVFLSTLRVSSEPVAALPGLGFYATETAPGAAFNWLRARGRIDLVAEPGTPRAWIRFAGESVDRTRTLEFRGGGETRRIEVQADRQRSYSVGPFPLRDGRARLTVEAQEPPRTYGSDPRPLSVRFDDLQATLKAPSR